MNLNRGIATGCSAPKADQRSCDPVQSGRLLSPLEASLSAEKAALRYMRWPSKRKRLNMTVLFEI